KPKPQHIEVITIFLTLSSGFVPLSMAALRLSETNTMGSYTNPSHPTTSAARGREGALRSRSETSRHRHGRQSWSRDCHPFSIWSHSTLSPTFHSVCFGSANTSPASVFRVAMPRWASRLVMVATTPVDTGLRSPWASIPGATPTTRAPVNTTLWTMCRVLIPLSFCQGTRDVAEHATPSVPWARRAAGAGAQQARPRRPRSPQWRAGTPTALCRGPWPPREAAAHQRKRGRSQERGAAAGTAAQILAKQDRQARRDHTPQHGHNQGRTEHQAIPVAATRSLSEN